MLTVNKYNILTFNKGDDIELSLFLDCGSALSPIQYELTNDDTLYFGIIEYNQPFECALVRKIFTKNDIDENNNITIKLSGNDTYNIVPGEYSYEIKLKRDTGNGNYEVHTVVSRTKLIILE